MPFESIAPYQLPFKSIWGELIVTLSAFRRAGGGCRGSCISVNRCPCINQLPPREFSNIDEPLSRVFDDFINDAVLPSGVVPCFRFTLSRGSLSILVNAAREKRRIFLRRSSLFIPRCYCFPFKRYSRDGTVSNEILLNGPAEGTLNSVNTRANAILLLRTKMAILKNMESFVFVLSVVSFSFSHLPAPNPGPFCFVLVSSNNKLNDESFYRIAA